MVEMLKLTSFCFLTLSLSLKHSFPPHSMGSHTWNTLRKKAKRRGTKAPETPPEEEYPSKRTGSVLLETSSREKCPERSRNETWYSLSDSVADVGSFSDGWCPTLSILHWSLDDRKVGNYFREIPKTIDFFSEVHFCWNAKTNSPRWWTKRPEEKSW